MFDFLKSKTSDEPLDVLAESESNGAPSGLRVEDSQSAEVIRKTKQEKSAKPDSGKGAFSFEENAGKEATLDNAKVLDALLDPKVWRGAVAAPGDAMVAITGKKHWELSNDERDTLAKTGAATARCFAVTDPKWLALSLFGFSILSIYGSRIVKDLKDKAVAKKGASEAVASSNNAA